VGVPLTGLGVGKKSNTGSGSQAAITNRLPATRLRSIETGKNRGVLAILNLPFLPGNKNLINQTAWRFGEYKLNL
jgi:hypothetical protein